MTTLADEIGQKYSGQEMVEARPASPYLIGETDSLEKDLCSAIKYRALDVEYQPFVDHAGRQVLGVEALVRWRRSGTHNVPPSVFVPIAERNGTH